MRGVSAITGDLRGGCDAPLIRPLRGHLLPQGEKDV
jgi:hypothetical protein